MQQYQPNLLTFNHPKTYHSFAGAFYVKFDLKLQNNDIITAIKYHTTGLASAPLLTQIVYVADKTSSERDYPGVVYLRQLATKNLAQTYQMMIQQQYEKLQQKQLNVNHKSLTYQAYLYWKE